MREERKDRHDDVFAFYGQMDVFLNALLLNSVGVLRFTVLCKMERNTRALMKWSQRRMTIKTSTKANWELCCVDCGTFAGLYLSTSSRLKQKSQPKIRKGNFLFGSQIGLHGGKKRDDDELPKSRYFFKKIKLTFFFGMVNFKERREGKWVLNCFSGCLSKIFVTNL